MLCKIQNTAGVSIFYAIYELKLQDFEHLLLNSLNNSLLLYLGVVHVLAVALSPDSLALVLSSAPMTIPGCTSVAAVMTTVFIKC